MKRTAKNKGGDSWIDGARAAEILITEKGVDHVVNEASKLYILDAMTDEFKDGFISFLDHYKHFQDIRDETK